jgi:hypothetical protein
MYIYLFFIYNCKLPAFYSNTKGKKMDKTAQKSKDYNNNTSCQSHTTISKESHKRKKHKVVSVVLKIENNVGLKTTPECMTSLGHQQ